MSSENINSDLDQQIKNTQPIDMLAEEEREWEDAIASAVQAWNMTVSSLLSVTDK